MNRSKILQEKLSDPADVARDEFEALMRRDDKVISGFKNKVQRNEQSLDRQSVRPQNGRNAETGEPLLTPVYTVGFCFLYKLIEKSDVFKVNICKRFSCI